MKLINPSSIGANIIELLDAAEKYVIIVSPYQNFYKWPRLKEAAKSLVQRNVGIYYFTRTKDKHSSKSYEADIFSIEQVFNTKPIFIKNLHAKFYLCEAYGIVTSMNLNYISDEISWDIAYETENKTELSDLTKYFNRFFNNGKIVLDNQYKEAFPSIDLKPKQVMLKELGNLCIVPIFGNDDLNITNSYVGSDSTIEFIYGKLGSTIRLSVAEELGTTVYSFYGKLYGNEHNFMDWVLDKIHKEFSGRYEINFYTDSNNLTFSIKKFKPVSTYELHDVLGKYAKDLFASHDLSKRRS
jgi:hypothetical protein